jgi:hypothetical protein
MKKRNVLLLALLFLSLTLATMLLKPNEKSAGNFRSMQSINEKYKVTMERILEEGAQVKRDIAKVADDKKFKSRSLKLKKTSKNPIVNHLKYEIGKYLWSPDVYALPNKIVKNDALEILGKYDELTIFRSANRPDGAFNIVYDTKTRKIGLYLDQIIVVHEKSSKLEDFISNVKGIAPNFHYGVYFVPVENFSDAQELGESISSNFSKAKVDLDINYNRVKAN